MKSLGSDVVSLVAFLTSSRQTFQKTHCQSNKHLLFILVKLVTRGGAVGRYRWVSAREGCSSPGCWATTAGLWLVEATSIIWWQTSIWNAHSDLESVENASAGLRRNKTGLLSLGCPDIPACVCCEDILVWWSSSWSLLNANSAEGRGCCWTPTSARCVCTGGEEQAGGTQVIIAKWDFLLDTLMLEPRRLRFDIGTISDTSFQQMSVRTARVSRSLQRAALDRCSQVEPEQRVLRLTSARHISQALQLFNANLKHNWSAVM